MRMRLRWSMLATGMAVAVVALGAPVAAPAAQRQWRACPGVQAWNSFFSHVSVSGAGCRRAARFVHAYAKAAVGRDMPRRVAGLRCTIRFRRNADGDVYASRHTCVRGPVAIRFRGSA